MKPHGPVLVVGTGRSGTSVIARVLQEDLDVDMGGPGNTDRKSNPEGDYEDPEFKKLDMAHRKGHIGRAEFVSCLQELGEVRSHPWGAKHPANATILEPWLAAFPRAVIIWARRDHEDTIASWIRWYGTEPAKAARVVERRHRAIVRALRGHRSHPQLVLDMTQHVEEDALAATLQVFLQRWRVIPTPGAS